jgi:hypothetical protein
MSDLTTLAGLLRAVERAQARFAQAGDEPAVRVLEVLADEIRRETRREPPQLARVP